MPRLIEANVNAGGADANFAASMVQGKDPEWIEFWAVDRPTDDATIVDVSSWTAETKGVWRLANANRGDDVRWSEPLQAPFATGVADIDLATTVGSAGNEKGLVRVVVPDDAWPHPIPLGDAAIIPSIGAEAVPCLFCYLKITRPGLEGIMVRWTLKIFSSPFGQD